MNEILNIIKDHLINNSINCHNFLKDILFVGPEIFIKFDNNGLFIEIQSGEVITDKFLLSDPELLDKIALCVKHKQQRSWERSWRQFRRKS